MRIHELLLIPAAGHAGAGTYSRGYAVDAMAEVDLVDQYMRALTDELGEAGMRYRVVPTRRAPGTPFAERYAMGGANILPIVCAIGWDQSKNQTAAANASVVRYATDVPAGLAAGLADAMAHWGALYVHGHKRSNPLQSENMQGLVLQPFKINGPNAAQYAAKLDNLGRDLGRFLTDYCISKNTGTAVRAPSLLRRIQ